jgi:hypothetical protein
MCQPRPVAARRDQRRVSLPGDRRVRLLIQAVRRLCHRPAGDFRAREVIVWWELRRPLFNVAVGGAGVFAIGLLVSFSLLAGTDCGLPDPPLFAVFGIFAYALIANVCYTGGWIAELLFFKRPDARRKFATTAVRWGFAGSMLLTASPGVVVPILCVTHRIVTGTWTAPQQADGSVRCHL